MKTLFRHTVLMTIFSLLSTDSALSAEFPIKGLKIASIRYVGTYADPQFRDTVELWFTTPLTFPTNSLCTASQRVYISASHRHLVVGAQLALALDRPINITVYDTLPIRAGACEIVHFDVPGAQ
jgi:hypothetical protein